MNILFENAKFKNMDIPKIIHYCWFGRGVIPDNFLRYIDSWKKYMPEYEIKEWNEDNFDVHSIDYISEAYKAKKFAFVSDYARFYILYNYGGIYFDTDVEMITTLDDILERGPYLGMEQDMTTSRVYDLDGLPQVLVNPGLGCAASPGMSIFKELMEMYHNEHFLFKSGALNFKSIVARTTEVLVKHGLADVNDIQYIGGCYIYPREYFCPYRPNSDPDRFSLNTRTIHHYSASWVGFGLKMKLLISPVFFRFIPVKVLRIIRNFYRLILNRK